MKNIFILVPAKGSAAGIFDSTIFFTWANHYLQSTGQSPLFNVQTVGLTRKVKLNNGLFTVNVDVRLKEIKTQADLIFIPAMFGDFKDLLKRNNEFANWIFQQYQKGAELASLCLGVFLLASTGLLKEKECPVHWYAVNEFADMFPDVKVAEGNIITQQEGIYSSASGVSHWNLLLYFLEKFSNREVAVAAAKFFAVDINRNSQLPFVMFNGKKNHRDEPIKQAQEYIENNFTDRLSVEGLAEKFAIGRRHFERRFKKATNNTPVEYIQRVKIEAAKKQLETGQKNVNEVMYAVGYSDKKAFRTVFIKMAGITPADYRRKFHKIPAAV
jgi:transcriptional regulator GlxA family with amidase domain